MQTTKISKKIPFFGGEDIPICILRYLFTTHQLIINSLTDLAQKVKPNYGYIIKDVHYPADFYYRPS